MKQRITALFLVRTTYANALPVRRSLLLSKRLAYMFIALTLVSLPLYRILISLHAKADSPSWLSSNNPTLTQLSQNSQYDTMQTPDPTTDGYNNIDCTNRTYVINTSTTKTSCITSTAYGGIGYQDFYTNELLLNGTTEGGSISYSGNNPVIAVPNSDASVAYLSSVASGLGVGVFTHTYTEVSPSVNASDHSVTYSYTTSPDYYVKDGAGNFINSNATSTAFSQNGQWMVYYSPTANAVVRVNLQTRQVLPFAATGGSYNAISDDGQYAALSYYDSLSSQWRVKVYDLSTCSTNIPATINGPVSCSSNDFTSFLLNSSIPNFYQAFQLRFDGAQNLDFYAMYNRSNGNYYTAKYRMLEPNVSSSANGYLAMGDSYASGEGAGLAPGETTANFICPRSSGSQCFIPGTDEDLNDCHLSSNSSPYIMSRTLNISSFHSVACSGAISDNISANGSAQYNTNYTNIPDDSLGAWLPGYQQQIRYLDMASPKPNVITLTDGGNDIGFSDIVVNCTLESSACNYYYQDRYMLAQRVNSAYPAWVKLYTEIKKHAPTGTKIYVTGYPSVVASSGTCKPNTGLLSGPNQAFANQFVTYLNYAIKQATLAAGVQYVDIQDALDGHRLCESETSQASIAINGYTQGEEYLGAFGSESFHPNEYGQTLLSSAVLSATSNFSSPQNMPDTQTINPPQMTDTDTALTTLLTAPHSTQQIHVSMATNQSPAAAQNNFVYFLNNSVQVSEQGEGFGFVPGATYDASTHSDPVDLGTITADANGNLNASLTIPSTVTPGYHMLDITGLNMAGQTVDVQRMIFVAYSSTDYLGTGSNSSKTCLFVPQSGVDANQDGIDDACEGNLDVAAPTTTASLSPSPNNVGNYERTVTASLSATATPGFSVANTYYTIDGGSQQTYSAPFTVSGNGSHTVVYWSVDNAGLTETQNTKTFTIVNPLASSLIDDWSSGSINTSKWNNWGSPQTSVVGQQLQISSTLGGGYYGVNSSVNGVAYSLANSYIQSQLVNAGNQSLTSWGVYPVSLDKAGDSSYQLYWAVETNKVRAYKNTAGTHTVLAEAAYNSSTHKWFRIRESSGTVYWDYSTDGISWTNFTSISDPFAINSVNVGADVGTWNTEASTTTATIDNFNKPLTSSVTEDWSSGSINTTKWNNWGSPQTSVVSQQLQISSTLGGGYYGVNTNVGGTVLSLTGSYVTNQLVDAGNQSLTSWGVYPVSLDKAGDSNYQIYWAVETNKIRAYKRVAGTATILSEATYDPSVHKRFRIREYNGTTYWDYSTDGSSWTNFTSAANPFDVSGVVIGTDVGTWQAEASNTHATFDNFNVAP